MIKVITIGNSKIIGELLSKDERHVHLVNAKVYRSKNVRNWDKYSIPMDFVSEIEDMEGDMK